MRQKHCRVRFHRSPAECYRLSCVHPGTRWGGNNAQSSPFDAGRTAGAVAGAVATGKTLAANSIPPGPSLPPRDWGNENPTVPYPDANIQVLDPRFKKYLAGTTLLRRVWTGAEWTEGPV
jgi:hypothetical protein